MGLSVERLDAELEAWKRLPGNGMFTFDVAYIEARRIGYSEMTAQQAGAHALLDAFVKRLKGII
jgi:hypothetical protein